LRRARRFDAGLRGEVRLDGVVVILLAGNSVLEELRLSALIDLGFALRRD